MSLPYHLVPAAEQDLRDILFGGYERFGLKQALAMQERIEQLLCDLGKEPGLGHEREDLTPSGRMLRYQAVMKRFVIVYQPDTKPIRVIAVVDGTRDIAALLPERV